MLCSGFHWMLNSLQQFPYSLPLTVQSAIMASFLKWRIWCYNQNSSLNVTLPILIPPPSICEKEWFQVLWLLAWPLCTKMWYGFRYELECKMYVSHIVSRRFTILIEWDRTSGNVKAPLAAKTMKMHSLRQKVIASANSRDCFKL